jgi:AcrR family transcriptional regulator
MSKRTEPVPGEREARKLATRSRLLRVAQQTFAKHGYEGTSVALVCRRARVTHGALYHHFTSKSELFVAVLVALTNALAERVVRATERTEGWAQVEAACDAYLDACTESDVQAIVLRDGPRVLPSADFDAIDHEANEPMVEGLLRRWIEAGLLRPIPVELVARMIGGAFAEAGAAIVASRTPRETRIECGVVLRTWLGAMRADAA